MTNSKFELFSYNVWFLLKYKGFFFKHFTYTVHADIKVSTAFKYETGGNAAWDLACCVDSVNSDVTPNVTRAGAASGFIQNETHFLIKNTKINQMVQ